MSTGWTILSTRLFIASIVVDAFWWRLAFDIKIFILCTHSHLPIHLPLLQNSFLQSLRIFLLTPWPAYQAILYCPWFCIYFHLGPFLLPHKWMIRCARWGSCHCKDFLSPLSFKVNPEWDCNEVSIYFQFSRTFRANPFVNQAQVFSSWFSCSCGTLHMTMRCKLKEEHWCNQGRQIGVWTTSQCNLHMLSCLAWAWSRAYLFHLIRDFCWAVLCLVSTISGTHYHYCYFWATLCDCLSDDQP